MLDALDEIGAPAAFFPITGRVRPGRKAKVAAIELRSEAIRRITERGHEVHLHGHHHLNHAVAGRAAIEKDMLLALGVLASAGVAPRFWRPPWGVVAQWSMELAEANGLELVGWTVDTHDWRGDSVTEMLRRAARLLAPGGVVLMHDGLGPGALRTDCRTTAELVGALVEAARARGLEPVPLTSLAGARALGANLVGSTRDRLNVHTVGARAS